MISRVKIQDLTLFLLLENNLEFVPFRNFEHLNLNSDQKALLQEILAKREMKRDQMPTSSKSA